MSDLTFYQWANVIKGYALAGGVAFAVVMIALWWNRSQSTQRADRQAQAKRVYANFLLQALQHPELAQPGSVEGSQSRQRAQYQWFVSYLLAVCDEILLVAPSPEWRKVLAHHLMPHRAFLASRAFREGPYQGLTREVYGIIAEVTSASGPQQHERPDLAPEASRQA